MLSLLRLISGIPVMFQTWTKSTFALVTSADNTKRSCGIEKKKKNMNNILVCSYLFPNTFHCNTLICGIWMFNECKQFLQVLIIFSHIQ